MARVHTKIGYARNVDTDSPGVSVDKIVKEQGYYGDVLRDTRSISNAERINDEIQISNRLSIVADPYAFENFYYIRYASYAGVLWRVNNVEVQYPRLILTLGGVYNGPTFESA